MTALLLSVLACFLQMDFLHIAERVLKLALPSMYAWMVIFYCLFHLWLNILAELLHFGDREFYKVSGTPGAALRCAVIMWCDVV